ncbi:MAG TPA: GNAT family N-acetyltransferase [Allosphingosinicella sp.]
MQVAFDAAAALGLACRPMTDADLPFVASLYASTRAEEVAATGWPEAMQAAFLEQQHQAQHHHYRASYPEAEWLIVERGGEPIGRLYLADQGHELLLVDVSLLPESRRAGFGGALVRDIQKSARTMNRPVSLHVERTNPAQRLYERLGFRTVEEMAIYRHMVWQPPAD